MRSATRLHARAMGSGADTRPGSGRSRLMVSTRSGRSRRVVAYLVDPRRSGQIRVMHTGKSQIGRETFEDAAPDSDG